MAVFRPLAWSHIRLGDLALARLRSDAAARWFQQAADVLDRLEAASPGATVVERGRCEVALLRAAVASLRVDPTEQERQLRAAHALAVGIDRRGITRTGGALLTNASGALAQFLMGAGRTAEARTVLDAASAAAEHLAELDGDSGEACSLRAKLHWIGCNVEIEAGSLDAGLGKLETAIPLLARARWLAPERADLVFTESSYEVRRAKTLQRLGRDEEARAAGARGLALAQELVRRWPTPAHVHWLGTQLLTTPAMPLRDPQAAVNCARTIQAIAPDLAIAWELEGDALAALGRTEEAIAALRRAVAIFDGQSPSFGDRCRHSIDVLINGGGEG